MWPQIDAMLMIFPLSIQPESIEYRHGASLLDCPIVARFPSPFRADGSACATRNEPPAQLSMLPGA
jgi:hypothetical protein